MDIKGLDYNTQREKLLMPEYGREIQKMVDYAIELPSREERLKCARSIVRMMLTKVPQIRDNADYEQTLWDHLYLMSGKQLDIDWPFDVSAAEKIHSKPQPIPLPQKRIRLRHYGKLVEELLEQLKTMADGPERNELVRQTANQMKRDLLTWGHGSADDEKVADDMARLTDGAVQLDLGSFKFEKVTAITTEEGKKSRRRK
ncbi:MAG: DUF4290 domain-containing protein [Paludibacteraceae bacterium]|jgi:hypothetical protein|nr:DUF4290 domain-containing protein [Paludibacteraceae bacterium]